MKMKLENMSYNLVNVIDKVLRNIKLAKYLYNNTNDPLLTMVNPTDIAPFGSKERILPYPFDTEFKGEQRSQLHVYFPELEFKNNEHVEDTIIWFDIVVHKKLWLFMENGKKLIRPYEIAKEIVNELEGTCDFIGGSHLTVNEEFDSFRLEARIRDW